MAESETVWFRNCTGWPTQVLFAWKPASGDEKTCTFELYASLHPESEVTRRPTV